MAILVVGRGWTGNKVFNELVVRGHVTALCSHEAAISAIENNHWSWVVNCAGVTGSPNVDACENDRSGTIHGNAIFPVLLHQACENSGAKLAHFSSGCIYQGDITDEMTDPNYFGSIYSISKGISDVYLRDKALVFRIRMPFTDVDEPKNYLTKVYNYAKNGKLVDFGENSLTDLNEAVGVACDLIEGQAFGAFNLVNKGSLNMHELAELMSINPEWYSHEEFAAVTKAGRSTCTIPAYEGMRDVTLAVSNAIKSINWNNYAN